MDRAMSMSTHAARQTPVSAVANELGLLRKIAQDSIVSEKTDVATPKAVREKRKNAIEPVTHLACSLNIKIRRIKKSSGQ